MPFESLFTKPLTPHLPAIHHRWGKQLIPTENYVAYNALARHFEGAKPVETIHWANDAICYVFEKDGRPLAAFWNYGDIQKLTVTLPADPAKLSLFDVLGNPVALPQDGVIPLTASPLYLETKDASMAAKEFRAMMQNAKVESEIPFVIGSFSRIIPENGWTAIIPLRNCRGSELKGEVEIQGAVSAFALPANAEGIVKASVTSSKLARDIATFSIDGKTVELSLNVVSGKTLRLGEQATLGGMSFKAERAGNALQLSFEVKDATPSGEANERKPWEQDCIEIFLDTAPGEVAVKAPGAYHGKVAKLFVLPYAPAGQQVVKQSLGDVTSSVTLKPDGYSVVLEIPFSALSLPDDPTGRCIGFDVKLNDAPGAEKATRNMDSYICRGGDSEEYRPRFTYTGFRYAIIEGYPGEPSLDDVELMVMHSAVPITGRFTAGSQLLSNISAAVLRTYLDNLHGGPTDCPTREKNFWNGDTQAFAPTACWYVDNSRLLTHWTKHGRKCGGNIYGWGDEEYILPWTLYRYYGDISILQAKYPAIQHLLASRGETLASTNARFRDHLAMNNLPEDFFAACFQCHMFKTVAQIASALGEQADARHCLKTFDRLRDEFNAKFLENDQADYMPHCQGGVVLPLAFDLVPAGRREKVAETLNRYVVANDFHPTVGFITSPHLLPLLSDFGYTETALKLATQTSFPSWGFMLNSGATTITENWWGHERCANDSMNHFALGGIGRWFFEYLGGIRLDPEVHAFKRFILKPVFYKDQSHIDVSYQSPYGLIKSSWLNNISPGCWRSCTDFNAHGCWQWQFTIPEGTTALVHVPGCVPTEYAAGKYTRIIYYR